MGKKAVIIMGPPGSGKGTQAALVADRYDLFHFDSGRFLRTLFIREDIADGEFLKEKEINRSGGINSGWFFLKVSTEKIRFLANEGEGIVFSGSPRTMEETIGNGQYKGFLDNLDELYGRENIIIFLLEIPEESSVERNGKRAVCSVCGGSILGVLNLNLGQCPFCGGELENRIDDKPETIKVRLEEYKKQTYPILAEMEKRGFAINKIDGTPMPYLVFESIAKKIDAAFKKS